MRVKSNGRRLDPNELDPAVLLDIVGSVLHE